MPKLVTEIGQMLCESSVASGESTEQGGGRGDRLLSRDLPRRLQTVPETEPQGGLQLTHGPDVVGAGREAWSR